MPYNPDGSFSILNEISTGYACNNALPPLIGADLDDIATGIGKASITSNILTGLIAQSRNSTLLNAGVLPPGVLTQVLQIGPCSLQTGDLLIADSFIDVLSNEAASTTRHAENYLFISTNPAATAPAMSSDNIGGNALNYYIDIVAGNNVTLTASGTAIVSSSGTYYLTNAIFWATAAANNASAGSNNSFGINLVRIRLPLGTI